MTDIPMTRRWAGSTDSATQAAGALVRLTLSQPRWWLFMVVVELMFALLVAMSFQDHYDTPTRVVWGLVYALVPTLGISAFVLGLTYLTNKRRFSQRLRVGVVLESGMGERSLVLRGPWAETMLSFDGLASVRSSGDWVFLRQIGSPVWSVWPAELFAPDDLTRLRRGVQQRDTAGRGRSHDQRGV